MPLPRIIALIGRPDCGKTTLIEKLLPILKDRGYTVGTIKHHVHNFEMDREGKDSWRHKRAGAKIVALSSPAGLGLIREVDHDHQVEELVARYFQDVDLVIAEGYKSSSLPKIEVCRRAVHAHPLEGRDQTWVALVSDLPGDGSLPAFHPDDPAGLTDFIIKNFVTHPGPPLTSLVADGQPVPLNNFVETFIRQAVQGMTRSLKGCRQAREITITIRNPPDKAR